MLEWTEHENEFGKWWTVDGLSDWWVEQIDNLIYAVNGEHPYKTVNGAKRFVERTIGEQQ